MRAGSLDRLITIQQASITVSDAGTPKKHWTTFQRVWAQMLQSATDDRDGSKGSATEQSRTFRIRWLAGLSLEHQIVYEGAAFKIRNIKEIGREGFDVSCERVGP